MNIKKINGWRFYYHSIVYLESRRKLFSQEKTARQVLTQIFLRILLAFYEL